MSGSSSLMSPNDVSLNRHASNAKSTKSSDLVGLLDPTIFVKSNGDRQSLDILVRGAKCGGCLSKIENTIGQIHGVDSVRMNLTTGRVHLIWCNHKVQPQEIISAITNLGYEVVPFDPEDTENISSKKERQLLLAMAVAGFAAANVMLLSVSVWAGDGEMNPETRQFLHWLSALIAIPVVAFSGRPFFLSALTALKSGHVNMDVPISLAVTLAVGMSVFETISHSGHTYFDAAVMLLFFLLIGRFLDAKLQREAQSAARDLALMQAVSVTKINEDGTAELVKASQLVQGDLIQISAGERFAVDAEILTGESDLDTRMVTGESRPQPSKLGQNVYAGTINLSKLLTARVSASAEDSMLSEVSKLLEIGEQKKSSYRQIADKAASLYVPIVHSVAALAFIGWVLFNGDIKNAIFISIAVLIITCPCALALAAPVVQVVAVGSLFRKNVYLKSGDALERIATIDHVIFDKTGTLTKPEARLVEDEIDDGALELAARLARGSHHPYSKAIVQAAGDGLVADGIEEVSGCGLKGRINGLEAKLGSAKWVLGEDRARNDTHAGLVFQMVGSATVSFEFEEHPVAGVDIIVSELKTRNIGVEILSGDVADRVKVFSERNGFENWRHEMSPIDKAKRIAELEAEGKHVLMIGDGLNDAGAIANAHASLTPGGALDISRSAGDGVFSGNDINVIVDIIDVARNTKLRMLENFGFAALYNVFAIPFAVLGFVTPLFAAIAMSGSSLIVTLNALRLNFAQQKRVQ